MRFDFNGLVVSSLACLPESEAVSQGDFMRRIFAKVLLAIIGTLAAMIVVLLVCAVWPVADKYPRQVAQTRAGPIEYTLLGQGPVVLRLTGSMDDCQSSGGNEALLAAGFSILTPSRPGYSGTPLSVGKTAPEAADAMAALMDKLGVSNADVIADSSGGLTAIYLAARHPERVRKLVLVEAVSKYMKSEDPKGFETRKKFYESQYGYLRYMLKILARVAPKSLALVTMSLFGSGEPSEAVKRLSKADINGICNFYLRWGASWGQAASNDMEHTAEDSVLNSTKAPTLIVHTRADAVIPFAVAEYTHTNIAGSELWEAPTSSHFMSGPGAAAVDMKVVEFLKK
jgi:pimeloyl-ACP methyl ester carboxylesterase